MKQSVVDLKENLESLLESHLLSSKIQWDELTLELKQPGLLDAMYLLRDQAGFDQLMDLCAVDYLTYGQTNWATQSVTESGFSRGVFDFEQPEPETASDKERRFAVVYHLLSVAHNQRVRIKVYLDDDALMGVDSVVPVWDCANWFEREAFDLLGVIFHGHPDLRRILTDYGFMGHPLRKDFPLTGHVEMQYDPDKERVVYQPVSIENRVNTPRVIREASAFKQGE